MNNPSKSSPESPAKEQPGEVAAMVRRLADDVVLKFRGTRRTDFNELHKLVAREAAALIEKLGRVF